MPDTYGRPRRVALALALTAAALAGFGAQAAAKTPTSFHVIKGYDSPGTPSSLNKVGILKIGDRKANNVLVLNPGTSAGAGYFAPLAKSIVGKLQNWQVWSVERRENFVEDQSELNKAKRGKASPEDVFNYYLGYLTDPSVTNHVTNVQDADVPFARDWGMKVEVKDLHKVVKKARKHGRNVVMGGHSLGGSITTAYATWRFNKKPGAKDLSGLVLIDGASSPDGISADQAQASLDDLQSSSPWLNFGGIAAPFAGLFGTVGSSLTKLAPNEPSILQTWPGLPSNLKGPDRVTNKAGYGYATDTETSPDSLVAAQVHAGHVAGKGDPAHGWIGAGELTRLGRWASMFSGWGLQGLDGTAWYHPRRLTIDSGAVGNGLANPAQKVLDVHSVYGRNLSHKLLIYAFGAALGSDRVPAAAKRLAEQSAIPKGNLTLIDRGDTYAHNDPNSARPKINVFLKNLRPFLRKSARRN